MTTTILPTLPLDKIRPDPTQVRTEFPKESLVELADSIASVGLINPLLTEPAIDPETGEAYYRIIAGERRWRALHILVKRGKLAPDADIYALSQATDPSTVTLVQLVEKLHREDLSVLDEASGYLRLATEYNLKQKDIAKQVGRSQAHVSKRLALLTLPDAAKAAVNHGIIGVEDAYLLSKLPEKVQSKVIKTLNTAAFEYTLKNAEAQVLADEREAALVKALDERMLTTVDEVPSSDTHSFDASYTAATLPDYVPRKGDVIVRGGYSKDFVRVYRKLTAKEKRDADTPCNPWEEWEAQRHEILSSYRAERSAARILREHALGELLLGEKAKDLTRVLVEAVITTPLGYTDQVGIPIFAIEVPEEATYEQKMEALAAWVNQDRTTRRLILWLLARHNDHLTAYHARLDEMGYTMPDEPVIPPEPWQKDDGTWTTEPHPEDEGDEPGENAPTDLTSDEIEDQVTADSADDREVGTDVAAA